LVAGAISENKTGSGASSRAGILAQNNSAAATHRGNDNKAGTTLIFPQTKLNLPQTRKLRQNACNLKLNLNELCAITHSLHHLPFQYLQRITHIQIVTLAATGLICQHESNRTVRLTQYARLSAAW